MTAAEKLIDASVIDASVATAKAAPFLKWAGGKRELVPEIFAVAPAECRRFYEPMIGGGALFFAWAPADAVIADANVRLVRTYRAIRDDVEKVIQGLYECEDDREIFQSFASANVDACESDVQVATWMLYLNRTCFNGLYRVNRAGRFNVPYAPARGAREIMTEERAALLRACSERLAHATIRTGDFEVTAADARPGDFVYFDPPYVPLNATSSFASYTGDGFTLEDQARLRDFARALARRGVYVVLSNSWSAAVRALYAGAPFTIHEVEARRSINSQGGGRGPISEALIVARV